MFIVPFGRHKTIDSNAQNGLFETEFAVRHEIGRNIAIPEE